MLDLVGYSADHDLRDIRILDPSCGDGIFVIEIIKRLAESSEQFGFDFESAFLKNVYAYDLDEVKIIDCRNRIVQLGFTIPLNNNILRADFLTSEIPSVDIVVGNPPYIRYEQIPPDLLPRYKRNSLTFHYRADLYILFFEKTLKLLHQGGHHCFICSNRWLKNEYGKKLRGWIAQNFRLESIVSLEKANDAFQEEVLAYPAITLISCAKPNNTFRFSEITSISQLRADVGIQLPAPTSTDWSRVFNQAGNDDSLVTIEEMGFMVGIGVATGADAIFISKDLPNKVEKELLLPALNAKDVSGNRLHWSGQYLLNPYKLNGELIDLEDYPRAANYLISHREALQKRHVAKKNPRKWYKTIDRIIPQLKDTPKVLLPDISGNQLIFVDDGQFYPQHNLYYITGGSLRQLQLLSAMLMSDYVKNQLVNITNCMNGGYPRWQSQYLRKLLMPDVNAIEEHMADQLLNAYLSFDMSVLNKTMTAIITSPRSKKATKRLASQQLSIGF